MYTQSLHSSRTRFTLLLVFILALLTASCMSPGAYRPRGEDPWAAENQARLSTGEWQHLVYREQRVRTKAKTASGYVAYQRAIRDTIHSHWAQPATLRKRSVCKIALRQDESGNVVTVTTLKCENRALRQSVHAIFKRVRKLPLPKQSKWFNRRIQLVFETVPR